MTELEERLLDEASRQQLIAKSVNADSYRDTSKGRNRYDRRKLSKVANTVSQYNSIDMDDFFKHDILTVGINVHGETDDYVVTMKFSGVLDEIAQEVKANNGKLEFKVVSRSLSRVFNRGNVFIHCNCLAPDTPIRLLDGTSPAVSELCRRYDSGEYLQTYSVDEDGHFISGKIEKVWKSGESSDFVRVTLSSGRDIMTTPEHPYMLRDGSYLLASELRSGMALKSMGYGSDIRVAEAVAVHLDSPIPVYDLRVGIYGNFTVGQGIVMHNCPDATYRQNFWQTKNGYSAGPAENRPSNKTNPSDSKGAGCKHVMLVLSNLDWLIKVASTVSNYIHYCQEYMQSNYADYIFPKLYGVPYRKAVQMNLFGDGLLAKDRKELDAANAYGASRGRFQKGNKYAFRPGIVWTSYDRNGNVIPPKSSNGQTSLPLKDGGEGTFSRSDMK